MSQLPRHPESNEDAGTGATSSRRTLAIVALVIGLVLAMVVLHLTGVVGAGSH